MNGWGRAYLAGAPEVAACAAYDVRARGHAREMDGTGRRGRAAMGMAIEAGCATK